jgi:Tfp pilus assembly protein PilP
MAMVQDANFRGYVLYEGMKIGYKDGRVTKIGSEGVVISETGKDFFGNKAKKEKILLIHPEER